MTLDQPDVLIMRNSADRVGFPKLGSALGCAGGLGLETASPGAVGAGRLRMGGPLAAQLQEGG